MKQVLIIGYVWPEPSSSAAGTRMMQLLRLFPTPDYSLTFATTAIVTPFCENLEKLGIQTKQIELNNPSFDSFIKELDPSIVIYDRFMMEEQFGWRVTAHCPQAITVLDTEDLHFLRNYREKKYKEPALERSFLKNSDLAKREISSIYRCDLSLIISEKEMEMLKNEFFIPENLLFYLPFLLDPITSEQEKESPDFDSRKNFISIGNFKHAPNVDAVQFLKNDIWPLIHMEIPDAKLLIFGAYPTAKINSLNDPKNNFLIKGRIEDAAEAVRSARVSLAALRFGAGLKGKLIEAMQNGTPTVTTPVGAEGINANLPWNGSIATTAQDFAEAAVNLYRSQKDWTVAVKNGYRIINSRFNRSVFQETFFEVLENLEKNLEHHRLQNFTGLLLKHHYSRSTYFLSKYIELKNQKEKTSREV
ncbi:glycosyltransferase family 4 protein [Antarcticibacterium sp. 1MA-6-2]|uniref:glycosyltransferase n=1 Tax=Antarcticibacterium sp. 1MA-6-2 TaxID=2908210 RepID=UPI001F34C864|nr:glycosyltransferase family 4 protein [Antarcticibacterium sp. 1MA-6-2]UJH91575.1 glycosyltransferase family 4 protein [Antarcticibacterium sp. 1MA-6-2]